MAALTNVRHELFAQIVASGENAVDAYEKAGYRRNIGNASTLRTNKTVAARIEELLHDEIIRQGITVERLISELAAIALFDLDEVVEWGTSATKPVRSGRAPKKPVDLTFVRLRNSRDIKPSTRRAVAKVKRTLSGAEIAPYDKIAAIRLLGQHLGMFKEQDNEAQGADALVELIVRARKRAQGDDAKVINGEANE